MADLFRPLLPADLGIASGIVISAFDDAQSAQQDIIIFDKRIIPPILFTQGPAIIPVESALACIEIKSCLTAAELRISHKNAESVKRLDLHAGVRDESGNWVGGRSSGTSLMLLALDTDLTVDGESEIERYKAILPDEPNWFSAICVAGRACYFPTERVIFDRPTGKRFKHDHSPILNKWHEVRADSEQSEMLALLTGVIQLIQRIGPARGQPPLDAYFNLQENNVKVKVKVTLGEHTGKYVGVSKTWESRTFESRDVGYCFCDEQEAFKSPSGRAAEIRDALKVIGIDSELVPLA